ncbi:MAG TPA: regulatory protein RecX [Thermoflexales bacterium]|nr:regulatory protein RecX [Thermoflexales bacterium]HQW34807.1 regulatory protein RecX [Thermoflexales bacterium]HQZ22808.1 regulatory protein RecX [Thermoflexales bacterium]
MAVHLDGEFAFGLALIHALWLKIGQTLTDAQIEELKAADTLEKARVRAVDFIGYRPRSVAEVRRRLTRAGVDEENIAQIVANLRDAGLLDDASFSKEWVESRLRSAPKSRRMMAWELRQKGVAQGVIDETLQAADVDDAQTAQDMARRRLPRLASADALTKKRKLSEYLARNGFDYAIISEAVAAVLTQDSSSTEE